MRKFDVNMRTWDNELTVLTIIIEKDRIIATDGLDTIIHRSRKIDGCDEEDLQLFMQELERMYKNGESHKKLVRF